MRQLFINITYTYIIIIGLIFLYLFCVKIKVSDSYEVAILDKAVVSKNIQNGQPKQADPILLFYTYQPLRLNEPSDEIRLRYDILTKKKRKEFITDTLGKIYETAHAAEYHLKADTQLGNFILNHAEIGNTYLVIRKTSPVYSILFDKIINPFLH